MSNYSTVTEKAGEELPASGKKKSFVQRYPALVAALVGIVVALGIYFWKDHQMRKQEKKIVTAANEQLALNSKEMLAMAAMPLVWSIRAEMMRGNLEQVNLFTADMVKEKNFEMIHLVDPGGSIIISTDKKLEGQQAAGIIDPSLLNTDSVTIADREGENCCWQHLSWDTTNGWLHWCWTTSQKNFMRL